MPRADSNMSMQSFFDELMSVITNEHLVCTQKFLKLAADVRSRVEEVRHKEAQLNDEYPNIRKRVVRVLHILQGISSRCLLQSPKDFDRVIDNARRRMEVQVEAAVTAVELKLERAQRKQAPLKQAAAEGREGKRVRLFEGARASCMFAGETYLHHINEHALWYQRDLNEKKEASAAILKAYFADLRSLLPPRGIGRVAMKPVSVDRQPICRTHYPNSVDFPFTESPQSSRLQALHHAQHAPQHPIREGRARSS